MYNEKKFIEFKLKSIVNEKNSDYNIKIKSSLDVENIFRQIYIDLDIDIMVNEHFIILSLNTNNEINGYLHLSSGTINATLVDSRIIGNFLFNTLAVKFIMCHNHPSGNLEFSQPDIDLTKKLYNSFKMFDITLVDSIILTKLNYNSYIDSGYNF